MRVLDRGYPDQRMEAECPTCGWQPIWYSVEDEGRPHSESFDEDIARARETFRRRHERTRFDWTGAQFSLLEVLAWVTVAGVVCGIVALVGARLP